MNLRLVERLSWTFMMMSMVLSSLMAPAAVMANSVPSPRQFWDINNDGTAGIDDASRAYQRVGGSWDSVKITSVTTAAATWRNGTDWNPTVGTSSGLVATLRVDGSMPGYGACGYNWSGAVAGNCVLASNRGTYYDIYESQIGINLAYSWNYGSMVPVGSQQDFRGVMTHELGHGVLLRDLESFECGSPVATMCGYTSMAQNGYLMRTLESDDVTSANSVYQP